MTEPAIIVALITAAVTIVTAVITLIRFLRKDRADANSVEEGTISARFKDADALMRYIDDRVDERTAALSAELAAVRDALSTVKRSRTRSTTRCERTSTSCGSGIRRAASV